MASNITGTVRNLTESRAEALQALLHSIDAKDGHNEGKISNEQVHRLSDKLGELLGDAEGAAGPSDSRNERGELLNEEGLPIIEISEPVSGLTTTAVEKASILEPPDVVPLSALSPEQRARDRAEMERILDLFEEEEMREEEENEALDEKRRREELEARKAHAKKELERLKAAKEMQKKMGKALLKNITDAKRREEQDKEEQLAQDMELEAEKKRLKPRKSVSFADLPPEKAVESLEHGSSPAQPKSGWGDVVPGRLRATENKQPMKFQVVERFPAPSKSQPLASPPPPEPDSDDESDFGTPVQDSDQGSEPTLSDDEDEESSEDPVLQDEFDFDTASHQREIALAYYEQRGVIGKDAARALSAHSHEPVENEWDQPEVPLEATPSTAGPKPSESRFKSSRIAQAYNTNVPSTMPSQSIGASVLPGSSSTIKHAVRLGKIEDEQLVGGEEGESASEDDDENIKAFLDAFRRGDVKNVGVEQNSDALIAALNAAYSAPPKSSDTTKTTTPVEAEAVRETVTASTSMPAPSPAKSKTSKFGLARMPPRSPSLASESDATTPLTTVARSSPKLPTNDTVIERKPGQASSALKTATKLQPRPQGPAASFPSSAMIVDSPDFRPPRTANPPTVVSSPSFSKTPSHTASMVSPSLSQATVNDLPSFHNPAPSMVVDSPSFQRVANQSPLMIIDSPSFQSPSTSRPSNAPGVMASTVRESARQSLPQPSAHAGGPEKRVSRFKAERS